MAGPHRLVAEARNILKTEFAKLPVGAPVVLAVSGGGDSMALAASAHFAARENLIDLHAVVVDHGIREESAAEADLVLQRLKTIGIPTQIVQLNLAERKQNTAKNISQIGTASAEPDSKKERLKNIGEKYDAHTDREGPEGAARRGRYDALARISRQLAKRANMAQPALVLLGHNADDQAESVILGFGRGSGARSVSGMPRAGALPVCPDVPMLRPLLDFTHAELCKICCELGIEYVEDPSNQLDGPWRNAKGEPLRRARVRHEILPLMEEVLDGGVTGALVRTATLLQEDGFALDFYAEKAWEDCIVPGSEKNEDTKTTKAESESQSLSMRLNSFSGADGNTKKKIGIACLRLAQYPRAIRTRVLRQAFLVGGGRCGELVFWHLNSLDKLVQNRENNRSLDLPGVYAEKKQHILKFTPRS